MRSFCFVNQSDEADRDFRPKSRAKSWALLLASIVCLLGPMAALNTVGAAPSLDVNGWTVFTQSTDSRVVYVSSSSGNDYNTGLSTSTPVKSVAKGMSLLRRGYPDWLLLKKGDTWVDETIGTLCVSGRSSAEPIVIGAYGTGERPLLKTNSDPAVFSFGGGCGAGGGDYMAIVGIEFYAYRRDPSSPSFINPPPSQAGIHLLNPINWLLIEDCKFSYYAGNAIAIEYSTNQNVSIRRNVIAYQYSNDPAIHAQGVFIEKATNLLIEENLFDHNGWNEVVAGAGAQVFNHNIYISYAGGADSGGPATIRGNIFARDSSGSQFRTGGTITNNLFVRNPYGHNLGQPWPGYVSTVQGNVHLEQVDNLANGGAVSAVASLSTFSSYAGLPFNLGKALISDNVLVRKGNTSNGGGIFLDSGQSGNTVQNNVSCMWNLPVTDSGVADIVTGNMTEPTSCDGLGFADPTRSIASYDAILGGPGTLEHFLLLAQGQRKDNWQINLTANAVNAYIKSGYTVASTQTGNTAPTPATLPPPTTTDTTSSSSSTTTTTSTTASSSPTSSSSTGTATSTSPTGATTPTSTTTSSPPVASSPAPVLVPPNVVINSPSNGVLIKGNGSISIAVASTDLSGSIASITITGDGKVLQTCANATSCTTTWQGKTVTQGTHTISATAVSSSGLQGTASALITAAR
jgi:hypothetical protein